MNANLTLIGSTAS